jgi:hypothetical protein
MNHDKWFSCFALNGFDLKMCYSHCHEKSNIRRKQQI